jgi:predicted DNA-binding protein
MKRHALNGEKIKTSIKLPAGLWKRLRLRSIEEGRDAQDIVAELIEAYLRKPRKGGRDAAR